jgi:hypothetical protein
MSVLALNRARIHRAPVNPMDRTTIVSVYPTPIEDFKPTIFPGRHVIEAAPKGGFSLLVVGPASWFKEMEEGQPFLEIQTGSLKVAEAFITDFVTSLLGSNASDIAPGLFYLPGEFDRESVQKWVNPKDPKDTFKARIEAARERQKRYFMELVKIADMLWSRTNGNPLSVSDDARLAATELNLTTKPWLQDFKTVELVPCPACGELVNSNYPVCKSCKAIVNKKRADELGIVFALDLNKK